MTVGILATAGGSARADLGIQLDGSALAFQYTRTPGPDGLVGHIEVVDDVASSLSLAVIDTGPDKALGGLDDVLVDLAAIGSPAQFDTTLLADVFRLGPNDYLLTGTWTVSDASSAVVMEGALTSTAVGLGGGVFYFLGELSNPAGLLVGTGDDWVFTGVPEDTPDDILGIADYGLDGVDGSAGLSSGRANYTAGDLVDFHLTGFFGDLDGFFLDDDRSSSNSDLKVQTIPLPGAAMLGLIGLGVLGRFRRRRCWDQR